MLTAERHSRIIADRTSYARAAGIPEWMLEESATKYCDGKTLDWLRRYPVHRRSGRGLCMVGKFTPPPDTQMQAMAAALVRNCFDGRVMTAHMVLDYHERTHDVPDPTVLLVPNLFVRQAKAGLPSWKMAVLYDVLLSRFTMGRATVVYVEDMQGLASEYGALMAQHLEANYVIDAR